MSHSKRNTSRAVFTSYERDLARKAWASTSARLNRESFLPFSACRLCLENAIDPVSCTHGDIFCRECALRNILAQKKEIKRLEKLRGKEDNEARERQAQLDAEAHERAVREFEMTQNGLDVRSRSGAASIKPTATSTPTPTPTPTPTLTVTPQSQDCEDSAVPEGTRHSGPGKRKFELDEDEVQRIAADDRAKARKAIDDEKAAEPSLPSFWVPTSRSVTASRQLHEVVKKTKTNPICPASNDDKPHTYSLHSLVNLHFTTEDEDEKKQSKDGKAVRICPSCKKGLGNSSKAMLAKPCGHVVCGSCVDKFMKPNVHYDPHATETGKLRCYVCDSDLTDQGHAENKKGKKDKEAIRPGLVELRSEGTGYSAGGANQVKKNGVAAFQC